MNQERTQKLSQLLQAALETVVVRHISRDDALSLDKYREDLRSRRTSYRPGLFGLTLPRVYPEIQDSAVKESLLEFIQEELGEYIHEGNIHSPTFAGDAFPGHDPLEQLLWNLLRNSIAWGIDQTVLDFRRCVEARSGSFLRIALLEGVRVENKIQVYEGVRLVPLPSSPDEFPTYMPDSTIFGVTASAFTSETVLVMDYTVTPLFRKPLGGESPKFQEELSSKEAPNFNLVRFCQALSLASNSAIQLGLQWEYFDEDEISMLSQTGGYRTFWGSLRPSFALLEYVDISEAQIHKAKGLYECWINLDTCIREAVQAPIERWIRSKKSRNPVDAMIDLGIALESLYLHLLKSREQLSLTFRLRAAWYLAKDREERERLLAEFKEIYRWRSVAVHEGSLPREARILGESFAQSNFIERAQDLCLESILKMMCEGQMPDWNNLILGGDGV